MIQVGPGRIAQFYAHRDQRTGASAMRSHDRRRLNQDFSPRFAAALPQAFRLLLLPCPPLAAHFAPGKLAPCGVGANAHERREWPSGVAVIEWRIREVGNVNEPLEAG
jgi:hypothetical protein